MKAVKLMSALWTVILCFGLLSIGGCTKQNEIRERNLQNVQNFLRFLEEERIEDFLQLFAEDGVQRNLYASGLLPAEVAGKQALREFWEPVPGRFDGMRFPIKEIVPMHDPNRVLVRFSGRITLKGGAGEYKNEYIGLFRFNRAGLIADYVEVFNPLEIVRSFGLKDQI